MRKLLKNTGYTAAFVMSLAFASCKNETPSQDTDKDDPLEVVDPTTNSKNDTIVTATDSITRQGREFDLHNEETP